MVNTRHWTILGFCQCNAKQCIRQYKLLDNNYVWKYMIFGYKCIGKYFLLGIKRYWAISVLVSQGVSHHTRVLPSPHTPKLLLDMGKLHCPEPHCTAIKYSVLHHITLQLHYCNTIQCTALHLNTLQLHYCNTQQQCIVYNTTLHCSSA